MTAARPTLAPAGDDIQEVGNRDTVPAPGIDATIPAPGVAAAREDFGDLQPVEPSNYVMGKVIAQGGMGQIVYARDRRVGRAVAIKQIHEDLLDEYSPEAGRALIARFEREARVTARLQHPSIVAVYEAGELDDRPFFAMRLVEGESLDKKIAAAGTRDERLGLLPNLISVADALAYAHRHSVIHRDLKPANVIVGDFGDTVVIDWGLAKDLSDDEVLHDSIPPRRRSSDGVLTEAGSVFGTPQYMPPEQARGELVDERADVYAIGAILYHLLAGHPPYSLELAVSTRRNALDELFGNPPVPLLQIEPDVPRDLVSVVDKAMARRADDRYADASELAADLRKFEAGQLVAVHDYKRTELLGRWIRKHLVTMVTAATLLVALIAVGTVSVLRIWAAGDQAQRALAANLKIQRDAAHSLEQQAQSHIASNEFFLAADALITAYQMGADPERAQVLLAETLAIVTPVFRRDMGSSWISNMYMSSDSSRFAVAGHDGKVQVWEAASGRMVSEFRAHNGDVRSIAFSNDANSLLTADSSSGEVSIWDVNSGRVTRTLETHRGGVTQVVWEAEPGARIATVGRDGLARLYDSTGAKLRELDLNKVVSNKAPDTLMSTLIGFGIDHESLLFQSGGFLVHWHLQTGAMTTHERPAGLDARVVGSEIVSHFTDVVVLQNVETGRVRQVDFGMQIHDLHSDGRNQRLAVGGTDGELVVYDLETGEKLRLVGHTRPVTQLQFGWDREWLLSGSADGTAKLWDLESGALLRTYGHEDRVGVAMLTPDGSRVITLSEDLSLRGWDTAPIGLAWQAREDAIVERGQFVAGDLRLLVRDNKQVDLRDAATGAVIKRWPHESKAFAVSEDGTLAIIGGDVIDLRTAQTEITLNEPEGHLLAVAISRDKKLAVLATKEVASVYSLESGQIVSQLEPEMPMMFLAFVGSTYQVLTLNGDKTVRLWNAETGGATRLLGTHADGLSRLEVSKDGRLAVSIGRDGARVWDLETHQQISRFETRIYRAQFNASGTALLTGSLNGDVNLWNPRTGERVWRARGHDQYVHGLQISADGQRALSMAADGAVRVVDIETGCFLWGRVGSISGGVHAALSSDGSRALISSGSTMYLWKIGTETRSADQLRAVLDTARDARPRR